MPLLVDQTTATLDGTHPGPAIIVHAFNTLVQAAWAHVLDPESGVLDVFGQFFANGAPVSDVVSVLDVQDVTVVLGSALEDGTTVTFVLTTRNGAGLVHEFVTTGLVDGTPPDCDSVVYLSPPDDLAAEIVTGSPAVLSAEVSCTDPHSTVPSGTARMLVGTRPGQQDVTQIPVDITMDANTGYATARGSFPIPSPVQGARYYVSFMVNNGVGLGTLALPGVPSGLLYTMERPNRRAYRLGRGTQVGEHRSADNSVRSVDYTLDGVFYDTYAQLTQGQLALQVCNVSGPASLTDRILCAPTTAATVTFTGDPVGLASLSSIRLHHRDVYFAELQWCNQAHLCVGLTSRSTLVDLVPPVMGGFVGASFSPEAPPTGTPTVMRFQSVDDVAYTVTDSYDADTNLLALQVCCMLWVFSVRSGWNLSLLSVLRCANMYFL